MASYVTEDGRHLQLVTRITGFKIGEQYTTYTVEVALGSYKWTLHRRYSEFYELHKKMYQLDANLMHQIPFPSKKVFGNQNMAFVQQRQVDLELYLQRLVEFHPRPTPLLARFLLWDKHEIHGITATLAAFLFQHGESWLASGFPFEMSVLQLFCLAQRTRLATPTLEPGHDAQYDLGHLMDFAARLQSLRVLGSSKVHGTSNIIPNQLNFDLSPFRNLIRLELINCNLTRLSGILQIKSTLMTLVVKHSLQHVKEILLQDVYGGNLESNLAVLVPSWKGLIKADFSENALRSIDESVKLMPNIKELNLSRNRLSSVDNLESLANLCRLNLSCNSLQELPVLHSRLGNIKELNLSENGLCSLRSLSKLYCLELLDVSKNQISELMEICHISCLPCLEKIDLRGNPVTIIADYRTKVFEQLGERASELTLDGVRATQKELDTAAVLQAIQKGRTDRLTNSTEQNVIKIGQDSLPQQHSKRRKVRVSEGNVGGAHRQVLIRGASLIAEEEARLAVTSHQPDDLDVSEAVEASQFVDGSEFEISQFRSQVETLREQAGDNWLTAFNSIRSGVVAPVSGISDSICQLSLCSSDASDTEFCAETHEADDEAEDITSSGRHVMSSSRSPLSLDCLSDNYCEKLSLNNVEFVKYVNSKVAANAGLSSSIDLLLWTVCVPHSRTDATEPSLVLKCCDSLIVFEVIPSAETAAATDALAFPTLQFKVTIALSKVTGILCGYRGIYVRVDESEVGCFVFYLLDSVLATQLVDSLGVYSTLNLVNLESTRENELLQFVYMLEPPAAAADMLFYAVTLLQGSLTVLLSVLVTPSDLLLLDERVTQVPSPGAASTDTSTDGTSTEATDVPIGQNTMVLLSRYTYGHVADVRVHSISTTHLLFPFSVELLLTSEAAGTLKTLKLCFHTLAERAAFVEVMRGLVQCEVDQSSSPLSTKVDQEGKVIPPPPESIKCSAGAAPSPEEILRLADTVNLVRARLTCSPLLQRLVQLTPLEISRLYKETLLASNSLKMAGKLQQALWTSVVPYTNPECEMPGILFLNKWSICFLTDSLLEDSMFVKKRRKAARKLHFLRHEVHCGILEGAALTSIFLKDLHTIYIGPFSQFVRLSGHSGSQDLTILTRDLFLTELIVKYIKTSVGLIMPSAHSYGRVKNRGSLDDDVDSVLTSSTMSETGSCEDILEDIYMYSKPHGHKASANVVEILNNNIRLVYPNEEILSELIYVLSHTETKNNVILQNTTVISPSSVPTSPKQLRLLHYVLLEDLSIESDTMSVPRGCHHGLKSTATLADQYFCLVQENLSQYPIPSFARGPPATPQYRLLLSKHLDYLSQVTLSSFDQRLVTFTFRSDDFRVDDQLEYFSTAATSSSSGGGLEAFGRQLIVSMYVQTRKDLEKLVKLVRQSWRELHENDELPELCD